VPPNYFSPSSASPRSSASIAGTFDDPNWFARTPKTTRHIFLGSAQAGTIIPAGVKAYSEHTMRNDGTPLAPVTFEHPHAIDASE
jgi:hypothetical protein